MAKRVELPLAKQEDVVAVRQTARAFAVEIGLSIIDQTKIVTAASELARNTIVHGGGGKAILEIVDQPKVGLQLAFEDQGPGIADLQLALQDGYTSGAGLGLGLGGSKRLSSDFSIESKVGVGTRVVVTRWKA